MCEKTANQEDRLRIYSLIHMAEQTTLNVTLLWLIYLHFLKESRRRAEMRLTLLCSFAPKILYPLTYLANIIALQAEE
jgi:hypothetical protein